MHEHPEVGGVPGAGTTPRSTWRNLGRAAACRPAETLVWAAVLTFLVAVPATGTWVDASGHDFARVIEIGLCLLCAASMALRRDDGATAGAISAPFALLVLALASTLSAPNLRMATRELTLVVGLIAVACAVARRSGVADATTLLATVSIAGASYGGLTFLGLAVNLTLSNELRPFNLLIGYDNGRFFNHVQTSMLPLLALATLHPFANRSLNRLAAFGLAIGIALLALSEGRATGLALLVAGAVGVVLFRGAMRPILRKFAIACAFAALIYLVFFVFLPRLLGVPIEGLHAEGLGDANSAHSRLALWQIALDGIRRSPWLGIGPMHFSHTWNSDAAHPHNVYLQVAEEWGLPMLMALLSVAFAAMRTLYRAVRGHCGDEADHRLGLGLFLTLIAIGVDGMLSGNFVMPVSQVWIAVVIGAAIGWLRRSAPYRSNVSATSMRRVWQRTLSLLPLLAMLWLCASVGPELSVRLLDLRVEGVALDIGAPRFWSNGWF